MFLGFVLVEVKAKESKESKESKAKVRPLADPAPSLKAPKSEMVFNAREGSPRLQPVVSSRVHRSRSSHPFSEMTTTRPKGAAIFMTCAGRNEWQPF